MITYFIQKGDFQNKEKTTLRLVKLQVNLLCHKILPVSILHHEKYYQNIKSLLKALKYPCQK